MVRMVEIDSFEEVGMQSIHKSSSTRKVKQENGSVLSVLRFAVWMLAV